MKKIVIIFLAVALSIPAFSQNKYKYVLNKRTGKFDLVTDSTDFNNIRNLETLNGDLYYPAIITNAGDTTGFRPAKAGNIFINTATSKVYISKSSLRGGWVLLNFFLPFFILRKKRRK